MRPRMLHAAAAALAGAALALLPGGPLTAATPAGPVATEDAAAPVTSARESPRVPSRCPPRQAACVDADLLADLLGWASRLSGLPLPPAGQRPQLQAVAAAALMHEVCGDDSCRGLVAVYDTDRRRILYADTLDMRDATDQSFLVHELVHYLQHRQRGERLHADCESVMASERQAYAVQNRYLEHFRQWRRVGEMMRFMSCPSNVAGSEPTVRFEAAPAGSTITVPGPARREPR